MSSEVIVDLSRGLNIGESSSIAFNRYNTFLHPCPTLRRGRGSQRRGHGERLIVKQALKRLNIVRNREKDVIHLVIIRAHRLTCVR